MRLNVHCVTHDIEYSLQCSACDEEEAKSRRLVEIEYEIEAQRGHLRVLELERDALYQRQNTGEYDCPYCLYRRLKTGVSHCPSCQAEITQEQWRPIFEIERALAREWPKKELKHEYKAQYPPKVTDANRTRKTAKKHNARDWNDSVSVYGGFMFLTLLVGTAIYWFCMR